ncbi:MAG: YggT family protein [Alteraurantiacibacter sp.]
MPEGTALLFALINIVNYIAYLVRVVVIIQFVLSLLISFNVVNMSNNFVSSIWTAVNAVLDPLLNPIRRIMPNTGAIDFSPLVLLIVLFIVSELLVGLRTSLITGML